MSVTARDLPEAVQWHEGMLLAPQHFQQLAHRQEALLHYHAGMISPYHWGVRHLKVDPVLLVDGVFRVLELEAVLPDGLVVAHFPEQGPDLSVDLTAEAERIRQRPLPVHLAVVARRAAGGRVDAEGARFESVEGEPVADENTGDGELRVPRLRPRLRLLVTDDPPPKYVSLPLAEVAYGNESFTTTPFIPPTLRVTPGSPLSDLCAAVATRLREKAAFLSEQVREPSSAVRVAQLLETRALVHGIVAALPPFEALLHSGVAHPFTLYVALCSLVGHLASVGRSLVPPVLEPYDHNDARTAFEAARGFIEQALREGVSESYVAYPFYLAEGGFFLKFDARWLSRPLVLGVRNRPGAAETDVEAWVEGAVIAAKSKMPELHQKRVLGLRRRRIEADADLVPARGVLLYSLGADPDLVVPDELLEIRNPDDPGGRLQPPEIVLYVRR
jgi:type VI secretion system protein ImpJ